MTERLICLACLVIGYGFGLLQIAHIYSRAKNINIREKGSGNAGTTNMFRVMGIRAGIITLFGDCAKCVAAVIITKLIFITWLKFNIDPTALALYTGMGCVLGHDFPFYFRFKGGKGMATTATLLISLGNAPMIISGFAIFLGIVIATQYVSLGSMVTICTECVLFIVLTLTGVFKLDAAWIPDCFIIVIILALLLLYQHRKNIDRLRNHCEKKFYFRTSKEIQEAESKHRTAQVNAKVEHVQAKAERKVDKLQGKVGKVEKKVDKLQDKVVKVEKKVERIQNKAVYLEKKAQIKAELREGNSKNWAGKVADRAPKVLKQNNENWNDESRSR
ncbi:MAG: glycerol-3-phosphate acyltransferase [Parasporobacterium sp.]|nr:glycerol-3-phosphate acyltransferase [Parasporobacterium sp.]